MIYNNTPGEVAKYLAMRLFKELLITLLFAVVIFIGLRLTVQSFRVEGVSMMPGIHNGEWLVVNKLAYVLHRPERGDVIVFQPPQWPSTDYIKRVIAVPGDQVEVRGGIVYVNGKGLSEPYIDEPPRYDFSPTKVGPNQYFVLGDNRNYSQDSHTGYMVPGDHIVGKAWVSLWPPAMWGLINHYELSAVQMAFQTSLLMGHYVR